MSVFRNFVFTAFGVKPTITDNVKYCIYQLEMCPKTNKEHFQGYCELSKRVRLNTIHKSIFGGEKVHIESRKGSQQQAIDYCSKVETKIDGPWEFGDRNVQGKRNDLEEMYAMVKAKKSMYEIQEYAPTTYCRHHKGLDRMKFNWLQHSNNKFRTLTTTVIVGTGGVGKTRSIYDEHGYDEVFKLDPADKVWFDGYNGEEVLLIDDFYGWIKWGMLLNILDGYPLRLPVKGSHSYAGWTKVYITSNKHPSEWYSKGYPIELSRRIHEVRVLELLDGSVTKCDRSGVGNTSVTDCDTSYSTERPTGAVPPSEDLSVTGAWDLPYNRL